MEKVNFSDILKSTSCFASLELKKELESLISENDFIVNFAYTDYGGDFFDKVAIEYFLENYPDNTISEKTVYSGKNCFIFGEVAIEFWNVTQDYLLGFNDIEDFYYNAVSIAEHEGFEYYINDELKDKFLYNEADVLTYLLNEKSGYYNLTTQGIDFSSQDLTNELLEKNVIFNAEESLLFLFLSNKYSKNIAEYYVTTYENGNIKSLSLDEKTLSIICEYENSLVEA